MAEEAGVGGAGALKISAPKLDLSVERYSAFRSWKSKWEDYVMLSSLSAKEPQYQAAMLRYAFTDETRQIYDSLNLTDEESKNPTKIMEEMEKYAKGIINETLERHNFRTRMQQDGEKFDEFLTEIIILSKNCNFCNGECYSKNIRDQILEGVNNDDLKQKLMAENQLTETKAKEMSRAHEKAIEGVAVLNRRDNRSPSAPEIGRVGVGGGSRFNGRNWNNNNTRGRSSSRGRGNNRGGHSNNGGQQRDNSQQRGGNELPLCKWCVKRHIPNRDNCPAYGKQCNVCRRYNHFEGSILCRGAAAAQEGSVDVENDEEIDGAGMGALYISAVSEQTSSTTPIEMNPEVEISDEQSENVLEVVVNEQSGVSTLFVGAITTTTPNESIIINKKKKKKKLTTVSRMKKRQAAKRRKKKRAEAAFVDALETEEMEKSKKLDKLLELDVQAPKGIVSFKIDSGADVSVMGKEHLEQFGLKVEALKPTRKKLKGANDKRIKCFGYFRTNLNTDDKQNVQTLIYVCEDVKKALLGKYACLKLKLIQIKVPKKTYISAVKQEELTNKTDKVVTAFPKVFAGLGFFGDAVHIEVTEGGVAYHINAPRRVSLPNMKPLRKELNRMEKLKVIRKVDEPTDWCHPIVIIPKPKSKERLRVCIDLTKLNEQVKREFYELPSVPETLSKIGNKCKVMSKLDFNSGYWQMPLDESSQLKCTFTTPFGRYCPTRAPFGLCSLPEIFTKKLDGLLSSLEGIVRSMDDILVHGETLEEHDERLDALLKVLEENGITLNLEKCVFRKSEIEFLGHIVSADGIKPIHERMEAVNNYPIPKNITELKSFLGMAQYLSRFAPELSRASEPLRDLLSQKNVWRWEESHTIAFNKVKEVLSNPLCLATYDVNRETLIRTDGSKLNGISVVLYQKQEDGKWRVVDCASRFLQDAEKNYYPIEIEMLGVMWGIKRMQMYLHGLPKFRVCTDHKPLIPILNYKGLAEMSPRIQAMRMKLLRYTFQAEHVPGKDLKDADAFSRAPTEQPTKEDTLQEEEITEYVQAVSEDLPASDEKLEEIRVETEKDQILQEVITTMEKGWPRVRKDCPETIKPYWDYRADLTVLKGVLVCGDRIVIPKTLRREMLERIHQGHLGMDKCKWRARQSICWPGMSKQIQECIRKCETCARLLSSKPKEPMLSYDIPESPWEMLGADLFDYGGKKYIVIVDYYSLWIEVYLLKRTKAEDVIDAFKQSLSRFGIPDSIYSDNGPQFKSRKYCKFLKNHKIKKKSSSPYFPQSNGLAESMVKVAKSLIRKCHRSNQDLAMGLLNLRNSPLKGRASPAQLLLGHQIQDNLPSVVNIKKTNHLHSRNILKDRLEAKQQYDKHVSKKASPQVFVDNQKVAVQDMKTKEWSHRGHIVEEVCPRSFLIELTNGRRIRRNRRFIRKVFMVSCHAQMQDVEEDQETVMDEDEDSDTLLYELSDSEWDSDESATLPYDGEDEIGYPELEEVLTTRSGRISIKKIPTDYEDL